MVRQRLKGTTLLIATMTMAAGATALAAQPATNNYKLNSYGFGSGGTSNSSTGNYSLEGISGEISSQADSTGNYQLKPGYNETQQANVPKVTLSNPSNYYDKLLFVLDQQGNPTDALYALQVSTVSNFSSNITYVKSDHTLGASLAFADYQTYSSWGSGSGTTIIGLTPGTTYYIRAKATQGKFTESAYGPSSNATTSAQSITFCLYSDGSCGSSTNATAFSSLVAGTPSNSSNDLHVTFATNADSGGSIYIYSTGKLQSVSVPSGTINSATADLSVAASGYGAQVTSVTSLTKLSPYNNSANNVGALSTTISTILDSATPVTGGAATIQLQAKARNITPAKSDYADTVTVIAAARF